MLDELGEKRIPERVLAGVWSGICLVITAWMLLRLVAIPLFFKVANVMYVFFFEFNTIFWGDVFDACFRTVFAGIYLAIPALLVGGLYYLAVVLPGIFAVQGEV